MHVTFMIYVFHKLGVKYVCFFKFMNTTSKLTLPKISCFHFFDCLYY